MLSLFSEATGRCRSNGALSRGVVPKTAKRSLWPTIGHPRKTVAVCANTARKKPLGIENQDRRLLAFFRFDNTGFRRPLIQ